MSSSKLLRQLLVEPGSAPHLDRRDPDERLGAEGKEAGIARLQEIVERLGVLHDRLLAEATRSVVLVLQGMDASGKDGTIRHILAGVNPEGCRVISFREPTSTDLAHDFLWRVHAVCPARGELAIFNRSHYEDVVAVRVREIASEQVWRPRFGHIRAFEQMLVDEGTTVVKIFLHLSHETQRERLQERLDNPEKRWKFQAGDLDDRNRWEDFMAAYEEAIEETSTKWAPWHVVPADHNWVRNLLAGEILLDTFERLDPKLPSPEHGLDGITVA